MSIGFNEIQNFLQDGAVALHTLSDCRDTSLGFNAFVLVSDTYRRENFHSDILSAILDPNSKHGEGTLFLRLFVAYLARVAKMRGKSDLSDSLAGFKPGSDIRVAREDGRIDVLVEGCDWAIIIENKINGADDMDRQLPRYVEKVQRKGKRVLAIVYITAATAKDPNQYGWKPGDQEMVFPLLLSVVGYNETVTELNLVVGWLERCELEAKNFAAKAVLSQYCELLRNQSGETMNQEEMMKLFSLLGKNKIAYSELLKILHGMPHTLAVMIVDACRNVPGLLKKPWIYRDTIAVFDLEGITLPNSGEKIQFAIDVHCEDLSDLGMSFFIRSGECVNLNQLVPLLQEFDPAFKYDEEWCRIVLSIDADQVFCDIQKIIGMLDRLLNHLYNSKQRMIDICIASRINV